MAHIDDLPFLGDAQVFLGILFSCVACDLLISHGQYHFLFPSYFFLVGFDKKIMQFYGNIMGPRLWESF
jgi:hypothetical protein